jgi:hypothetical protein
MGDTITKYHEMMSDREIMDAKRPNKAAVRVFEREYPELSRNLKKFKKKCMKCLLVSIWIMV